MTGGLSLSPEQEVVLDVVQRGYRVEKNALYPMIIGHFRVGLYVKYKAVRTGVEPVILP